MTENIKIKNTLKYPKHILPFSGLQTFASTETAAEEPKEPEEQAEKPEVKEEPKGKKQSCDWSAALIVSLYQ